MNVTCPTCKKNTKYNLTNKYRPFCSEKCKLIDLGAWASEEYNIPGVENGVNYEDYNFFNFCNF